MEKNFVLWGEKDHVKPLRSWDVTMQYTSPLCENKRRLLKYIIPVRSEIENLNRH